MLKNEHQNFQKKMRKYVYFFLLKESSFEGKRRKKTEINFTNFFVKIVYFFFFFSFVYLENLS